MSKIIFDIQLFFVFLANAIIEFPSLRKSFENFYNTDKHRFHEAATRSSHYNEFNMSCKTLDSEVAMRRAFGILQCAEEDEIVRDFVCNKLTATDKRFAGLVRNPNREGINAFISDKIKQLNVMPDSSDAKVAPMYFLAYLLYSAYGVDGDNKVANDFLSHTHNLTMEMNKRRSSFITRSEKGLNISNTAIPKKQANVIKQIKSGFDLACFLEFREDENIDSQMLNAGLKGYMREYSRTGSSESDDLQNALTVVNIAKYVSAIAGVDLTELNGPVSITRDEQSMLIKRLAEGSGSAASGARQQIYLTKYIIGHITLLLAKEIRNIKEFYFRNNSETQYLKLQRLENAVAEKDLEIARLTSELAKVTDHNAQHKEEIATLTGELFKDNKAAIKPYESEIAELNSRIRELEKALESEQAKLPELHALREFAFAAQSDYVPPETTATLAELVCGKKIIIVGGHINWRNKMKAQYPTITYIDGHNVSLDVTGFDNAHFILLNVANMTHKLYYKVIGYLRDKKLKFDYLGRTTNHELMEAEIASILKDKM